MGKLKELIRKKRATKTIKRLSKEAVVLNNNYTTQYEIEGTKTYGYLDPWKSIVASIDFVYNSNYESKYVRMSITEISFAESEESMVVFISTSRPGMLIGKYGMRIAELKDALTRCFGKPVDINIKESKPLLGMRSHENY
jgi:hypothetical protein